MYIKKGYHVHQERKRKANRSEERRVGKDRRSVDLGGRRIIKKKNFFQAEDGIRDLRT